MRPTTGHREQPTPPKQLRLRRPGGVHGVVTLCVLCVLCGLPLRAAMAAKTVEGFDEERSAVEPQQTPERAPEAAPDAAEPDAPDVETKPEPAPTVIEPVVAVESPGPPALPGRAGLGIRAGVFLPGEGESEKYNAGAVLGLSWQRLLGSEGRFGYEFGLDYGGTSSRSGAQRNTVLALRAGTMLNFQGGAYLLGGLGVASETVDDDDFGASSATGSSVDIGGGVRFSGVDIRLMWSILVGSDNVADSIAATVGYVF